MCYLSIHSFIIPSIGNTVHFWDTVYICKVEHMYRYRYVSMRFKDVTVPGPGTLGKAAREDIFTVCQAGTKVVRGIEKKYLTEILGWVNSHLRSVGAGVSLAQSRGTLSRSLFSRQSYHQGQTKCSDGDGHVWTAGHIRPE